MLLTRPGSGGRPGLALWLRLALPRTLGCRLTGRRVARKPSELLTGLFGGLLGLSQRLGGIRSRLRRRARGSASLDALGQRVA